MVGVFIFSVLFTMHLSEKFFILKRTERDLIKKVFLFHVKCPLFLSDFN